MPASPFEADFVFKIIKTSKFNLKGKDPRLVSFLPGSVRMGKAWHLATFE